MSKRSVDAVFEGLFVLTELRALLRETAPTHNLDPRQKERAEKLLKKLKKQVTVLEEEIR